MVNDEVQTWQDANKALHYVLYHDAEKLGKY
jgi:hypothetical protein